MNQQCKVCGEPAAGFHFGAFTCEGCKSFFGRSYNNMNSIADCKNGGECVINKKNRTACKACRLKKCFVVGMSKSGSRYGRRSNWFKIHCLLQEQQQQQQQQLEQQLQEQQQQQQQQHHYQPNLLARQHQLPQQQQQQQQQQQRKPTNSPIHGIQSSQRRDEAMMLGLDDYKNSSSPSISSPESHNSDSSVEVSERRGAYAGHSSHFRPPHPPLSLQQPISDLSVLGKEMMGLPFSFPLGGMPTFLPPTFLPPSNLGMFQPYHLYTHAASHPIVANHTSALLRHSPAIDETGAGPATVAPTTTTIATTTATTAVSRFSASSDESEVRERNNNNDRFYLDTLLKNRRRSLGRSSTPKTIQASDDDAMSECSPEREVECSPPQDDPMDLSMKSNTTPERMEPVDDEVDAESLSDEEVPPPKKPIDLTTRSKDDESASIS